MNFSDESEKMAYEKALRARDMYNTGQINFKEAEEMMADFREVFNRRSAEIAEKYGQKPQRFSAKMFMKYGRLGRF